MPEPTSPRCPLCTSDLVRERFVVVNRGMLFNLVGGTVYDIAWVCTGCSAAFPVALGKGRFLGTPQPLFERRAQG